MDTWIQPPPRVFTHKINEYKLGLFCCLRQGFCTALEHVLYKFLKVTDYLILLINLNAPMRRPTITQKAPPFGDNLHSVWVTGKLVTQGFLTCGSWPLGEGGV